MLFIFTFTTLLYGGDGDGSAAGVCVGPELVCKQIFGSVFHERANCFQSMLKAFDSFFLLDDGSRREKENHIHIMIKLR
jgi:hypothetical protein